MKKPNCLKAGAEVDKYQVLRETAKDFLLEVVLVTLSKNSNPVIQIQKAFPSEHFGVTQKDDLQCPVVHE